jgi:hypothetical protein
MNPLRLLQRLCGVAIFAAFMFSWVWALTFYNRVSLYLHRAEYQPDTFTVTEAVYSPGDEGGDSYWLEGTVRGRKERLVPSLGAASTPESAADLAALYPRGARLEVLYNPNATTALIQNESLRVMEASPDFWEREQRLRNRLGLFVVVPVPATLTLYLLVWYANRRQRRSVATPTP